MSTGENAGASPAADSKRGDLFSGPCMIDLHCHILPGIDDGAVDLGVSLDMARASVADGVSVLACTPHILPGLYHNEGPHIVSAIQQLQDTLEKNDIPLRLVAGADVHMVPDLVSGLRSGRLLSLAGSRYVLIEPPLYTAPPQLESFFFSMLVEGFVPVLTHPERLKWLAHRYDSIRQLARAGVWMQITSGSLAGAFGRNAQYWAHRMLDEGCVHVLATDAHDTQGRRPDLRRGRDLAAARVGIVEAEHLVLTRPKGVVENDIPANLPMPVEADFPNADFETKGLAERANGLPSRHTYGGLVDRLRHFVGSSR
jgi:protein-tyrosine phosphatase